MDHKSQANFERIEKQFERNYEEKEHDIHSSLSCSTKELLLDFMKETKIHPKLQKELIAIAEAGKPFPYVPKHLIKISEEVPVSPSKQRLFLPPRPMLRTKHTIEHLGGYEREQFRPIYSENRPENEKEKLQNKMAFGTDFDPNAFVKSKDEIKFDPGDLFDDIVVEIKERKDFLRDMIELGQGNKYFNEIHTEIVMRLRELEKLNKERAKTLFGGFEFEI